MRRAQGLRQKMNEVDTYSAARALPPPLREDMYAYYRDCWVAYEGMKGASGHLTHRQPAQRLLNSGNVHILCCHTGSNEIGECFSRPCWPPGASLPCHCCFCNLYTGVHVANCGMQ